MAASGINWIPAQTFTRSEADYVEAVKLCLERGADVNATNSLGLAAIHGAANRGWVSVIQILADHGAKLDVKDAAGRTPMTFAEGIFLAIRPPVAKPEAIALLKKLMRMNRILLALCHRLRARRSGAVASLRSRRPAVRARIAGPRIPPIRRRRRCWIGTASPATTSG